MKQFLNSILIVTGLAFLAGCSSYSGTTYGTGTTHEEDTMKSLINVLAIKPGDQEKIDYNARPDLVMPANKQALPTPAQQQANAEENWPVSPEQRIAAIREAAPEADWRTGDIPLEFQLAEKEGISRTGNGYLSERSRARDKDSRILDGIKNDINGTGEGEEARRIRNELAYSTGVQRKYLTEPPTEYRTPSENSEAGNTGVTTEEILAEQKRIAQQRKFDERGLVPTPAE